MKKNIIEKLVKKVGKKLLPILGFDIYSKKTWSQEGEDLVLDRIFGGKKTGYYIDVGAHHPKRFSNTFLFYRKGWRGINIDAMPGSMAIFKKYRSRDVNLEVGVGAEEGILNYYIFNETALNGFSEKISQERHGAETDYKIINVVTVDVLPLSNILDIHLPAGQCIDFLTIDVEGLDYDVLISNNWVKYRPKIVIAEVLGSDMSEIQNSRIGALMSEVGYVLHAKTMNTVFFKEQAIK